MASSIARKNPVAAIEAFKQAFGNDRTCRLIVRTLNANMYPDGCKALMAAIASAPNIQISDGTSASGDIEAFYLSADVVLSLHRSEGFGLVIAEAMLYGLPVLATNWSGNVDFLTPKNGLPVSFSLVPALDPQGTYDHASFVWAEANIQQAAAMLRMMRDNPDMRAALGKQAASDAVASFGVETYSRIVEEALELNL
jgi:glycosyltransferase involved in cell wall biosynthesis